VIKSDEICEIGRVPNDPQRPDLDLARELALGFWANRSRPHRDVVGPRRRIGHPREREALVDTVETDSFRTRPRRLQL